MTNLPKEEIIKSIMIEIYLLDYLWPNEMLRVEEILEKHLSLPKQEDLHDLLWKAFTILCNKGEWREEDILMRKQLEWWLENNSMNIDFSKEQEAKLWTSVFATDDWLYVDGVKVKCYRKKYKEPKHEQEDATTIEKHLEEVYKRWYQDAMDKVKSLISKQKDD